MELNEIKWKPGGSKEAPQLPWRLLNEQTVYCSPEHENPPSFPLFFLFSLFFFFASRAQLALLLRESLEPSERLANARITIYLARAPLAVVTETPATCSRAPSVLLAGCNNEPPTIGGARNAAAAASAQR